MVACHSGYLDSSIYEKGYSGMDCEDEVVMDREGFGNGQGTVPLVMSKGLCMFDFDLVTMGWR